MKKIKLITPVIRPNPTLCLVFQIIIVSFIVVATIVIALSILSSW